ncbi:MAG: YhjD/YihY/BrkB family envelope integrity protein [Lawsonibacter sp.]
MWSLWSHCPSCGAGCAICCCSCWCWSWCWPSTGWAPPSPSAGAPAPCTSPPLLSAAALVACSVLFSWFIGMSSRYSLVYGSLASLIILLVWLYFCGNILLLGAVAGRVWGQLRIPSGDD